MFLNSFSAHSYLNAYFDFVYFCSDSTPSPQHDKDKASDPASLLAFKGAWSGGVPSPDTKPAHAAYPGFPPPMQYMGAMGSMPAMSHLSPWQLAAHQHNAGLFSVLHPHFYLHIYNILQNIYISEHFVSIVQQTTKTNCNFLIFCHFQECLP